MRSSLNVIVVLATAAAVARRRRPCRGRDGNRTDRRHRRQMPRQGGTVTNGNPIQLWTCSGLDRQRWTLPGVGTIRVQGQPLPGRAEQPRYRVDHCGVAVDQVMWLAAQLWTVRADGTIVNLHPGLCLARLA